MTESVVINYLLTQSELLLRLLVSCILGVIIGFERKNRNKIAGVRTHAVVAFAAALMMIVSKYGFSDIPSYDASRVAAQIVSGVGFLGAGIIFVKDKYSISGLTTAAGLWATAGVGMCAGAGLYMLSICSAALLLLLQETLHRIGFLARENFRTDVKLTVENDVDLEKLEALITQEGIEISHSKIVRSDKNSTTIEWELVFAPEYNKIAFLMKLAEYPGVIVIRE